MRATADLSRAAFVVAFPLHKLNNHTVITSFEDFGETETGTELFIRRSLKHPVSPLPTPPRKISRGVALVSRL